ncbi:MAG TPA: uracil-DNA glycosylase family protein [Woeseiaceae bacterium]|nr:uracil-DNA glycosylase family protein [Woeseiaceae bacterium]
MSPERSTTAEDFLPERMSLSSLTAAASSCRACGLWKDATQTVFGEGLKRARLMLVGEMPGNDEDLAGHPFVGPAGRILDRALGGARFESAGRHAADADRRSAQRR